MTVLGGVAGRYVMLAGGDGGDVVCLEGPGGVELPVSVVVGPGVIDDALDAPWAVVVGEGAVRTRRWQIEVTDWRDDRVGGAPAGFNPRSVALTRALLSQAAELPEPAAVMERAESFCAALAAGTGPTLRDGAEALIGLGLGSTPAGDDLVAAATATLWAARSGAAAKGRLEILRAVIEDRSTHTAPLSGALLRAAARGRAAPALRKLVKSLASGHNPERVMQKLLTLGHSSGYFLAAGALAAAEAVTNNRGSLA